MSLQYEVMYRVGFTPRERAGEAGHEQLSALIGRERARGRALDVGCGTGRHTIELAEHGWEAVGIDAVKHALAKARRRAGADKVRFVAGDVTRLAEAVEGPFTFFLDIGCLHGLKDGQRRAAGAGITQVAAPDATMLVLAFHKHRNPLIPEGVSRREIEEALPGWRIDDVEPASVDRMPKPIQAARPTFYRLVRV